MARVKEVAKIVKQKIKRKGVHAKTKTSKVKGSKNYTKMYRGQGR
jgi:CRISPR/Cas system-associated protein Csm6